jgi:hypothetical protein
MPSVNGIDSAQLCLYKYHKVDKWRSCPSNSQNPSEIKYPKYSQFVA